MFQVRYSPGAVKALKKIPKDAAERIVKSIDALSEVNRRGIKSVIPINPRNKRKKQDWKAN
jgi:mRNA-degrading endonuclease RelE of RelBE toxin-antitoxin system